jgi:hypothetical protein
MYVLLRKLKTQKKIVNLIQYMYHVPVCTLFCGHKLVRGPVKPRRMKQGRGSLGTQRSGTCKCLRAARGGRLRRLPRHRTSRSGCPPRTNSPRVPRYCHRCAVRRQSSRRTREAACCAGCVMCSQSDAATAAACADGPTGRLGIRSVRAVCSYSAAPSEH